LKLHALAVEKQLMELKKLNVYLDGESQIINKYHNLIAESAGVPNVGLVNLVKPERIKICAEIF
jgi:hypothetical protein